MQRGLDQCIAAVLCAGLAGCLLVSSGCSTLVPADACQRVVRWVGTADTTSPAVDAGDGDADFVPLTKPAGEPVVETLDRTRPSADAVGAAAGTGVDTAPAPSAASLPEPQAAARSGQSGTDTGRPEPRSEGSPSATESANVPEALPPPFAELSVAEVLAYALQHHPVLRLREHEIQLAQARVVGARLLPNPQLVLDTRTELQGAQRTDMNARVMFTLPTGPKRRLRTAAARAGVQASQAALSRETKAVLTEVTDAAVAVLYWQERCVLERHFCGLARQAAETQRELFKIAAVPYRDTLVTETALANAVLAERDATARLQQARLRLARAMGLDPVHTPALRGQLDVEPLPQIPLDDLLACAGSVAPELAQARYDVAASEEQLAYEQWRRWPDLSLGPRYRAVFADRPDSMGARLAVDLPVFDRNQGNIAAAAAQLQSNVVRVQLIELTTLDDVAALYGELYAVDADLEYYTHHLLPLAEQTTETIQQAFQERVVGAIELVDLLQQAGRIRKCHLDLRWQHVRLRARLEILLEQRLTDLAADGAGG